ncbi:hypothetical protein NUACC21_66020 [Scytonema sp. NUACC21]
MKIQNLEVNQKPTVSENNKADIEGERRIESKSAAEIQAWIVSYLAAQMEIDPDEVEVTIPFDSYGIDSLATVGMSDDLQGWLGRKLKPTLLYDYPTVEALSQHLAETFKS